MNLRALIFDVDGTLAETEEAHRTAFNQTFAAWGLDWNWSCEDYHELLKTTGGKERMRAFQDSLLQTGSRISDNDIARLHKDKTAAYGAILEHGGLGLRPGVAELVKAARRAGIKLAIATTTNTPNVEALCRCCWGRSALDVFDHVAAGDMVAQKKPAPDVFLLALEQLGLPADECLALEDSQNGVMSARRAGLRVLVTPSAYTNKDNFEHADWVVSSLQMSDLPADVVRGLSSLAAG